MDQVTATQAHVETPVMRHVTHIYAVILKVYTTTYISAWAFNNTDICRSTTTQTYAEAQRHRYKQKDIHTQTYAETQHKHMQKHNNTDTDGTCNLPKPLFIARDPSIHCAVLQLPAGCLSSPCFTQVNGYNEMTLMKSSVHQNNV